MTGFHIIPKVMYWSW